MEMTGTSPILELNNGVQMPALGLGVFQSPPEATLGAVEAAIADGYRLIDTAAAYGNEREVGKAIRRSGVNRAEIFVTTKLWISDYGYEPALRGSTPACAGSGSTTWTCTYCTSRCRRSSRPPWGRTRPLRRSSRVMPGLRGTPDVMTTRAEPAVAL